MTKRIKGNKADSNVQYYDKGASLNKMESRLNAFGGIDQWTRMRQDKLRSLKKALFASYQKAIVQKYNVKKDSLANNIIAIITLLQDKQDLTDSQIALLDQLEQKYPYLDTLDRDSLEYISVLEDVVDEQTSSEPLFRCLINHDKLKVDYEDKIISIPFLEPPQGSEEPMETDFHNGTVFKWIHGNREEWTPDTYWIVYMQYSEETAYFRAEIRKADEEIEIVVVDSQGNESSVTYRGWMTGPNETTALWNVKKNVTWNDMNYTKLLYITKDEDTLAFFQRFDRIIINGKPWEVQAYNEHYSTSKTKGEDSGIIRVALKETYTTTDQFIKERNDAAAAQTQAEAQYDAVHTQTRLEGPTSAYPYDILLYKVKNLEGEPNWSISNSNIARITNISEDGTQIRVEILATAAVSQGLDIQCGDIIKHIQINSL